jgi:hypothetical protein
MTERADFTDSIRQLAATVLVDSTPRRPSTKAEPAGSAEEAALANESRPRPRPKPETPRPAKLSRQQMSAEPNVVTVTTRYPKEIDFLISKASFAQRMKGLAPGTKQEILVAAASDWLRRNGYLRFDEPESQESETPSQNLAPLQPPVDV